MQIKSLVAIAVLATAILSAGLIGAQSASAQIADVTSSVANWCHTFNKNLRDGDKGSEVKALQTALIKEGFLASDKSEVLKSLFSDFTGSAVVQFQEKYAADILAPYGLTTGTGKVATTTRAKLNALYGCKKVGCTDTDSGKDYFTKGTVSWTYYAGSDLKTDKLTDFCSTPGGGNALYESYCDVNAAKLETVNCEKGCENGACKPIIQPSITITSPNEDTKTAGQTKNITWTSVGLENKNVSIVYRVVANGEPTGSITYLANKNISAAAGSYSWEIPSDLPAGKYAIYIGQDIPIFGAEKALKNISRVYVKIVSPSWCYTFPEDLYSGVPKPKQVKALQTALRAEGFYGGDIDGVFDVGVLKAVKDFQKKNDINPTGKVASVTRAKLNALYGCVAQPSITITSPNGGEQWQQGQTYNITWNSGGIASNDDVKFDLYKGGTYLQTIPFQASQTANIGTYTWTIPTTQTVGADYKIRIRKYIDATIYDESDNYFSIVAPADPSPVTIFRGVNYSGSSQGYNVGSYTLSLMRAKGTLNDDISSVKVAPGYQITFYSADNFRGSTLVKTADDPTLVNDGWNDRISSIVVADVRQPSITVTSPNGGVDQKLEQGKSYTITWTAQNVARDVAISIRNYDTSINPITPITMSISASAQSYLWTVPTDFTIGDKYKIRVGNSDLDDWSDNYFSIVAPITVINGACGTANGVAVSSAPTTGLCATGTASAVAGGTASWTWTCAGFNGGTIATCSAPVSISAQPSITVTSPNGGEWKIEETKTITWDSRGLSSDATVTISIVTESDVIYPLINISANQGTYVWTLPAGYNIAVGIKIKVKIVSYDSTNQIVAQDSSDNYITVTSATPTTYTLTTSAVNGTITKNPDQATYNSGTQVVLTATANSGYRFVNWTGDASGTTSPVTVTMNANKSVTANFTADAVANCTDTDNGKDYNVGGRVVDSSPQAIAQFGAPKTFDDLCYAADKRIFEYYCDANLGYSQGEYRDCLNGCSNDSNDRGRCNQTAAVAPAAWFNNEDLIASISAAVARIAQQIQELLSARQQ